MKYKYDFMSIERTNTVKEILKSYNIPCKIENTVIELFDPFMWVDEEDCAEDCTISEKRAFDLIRLKKCQYGLVNYLYFEIPKLFKISQTLSFPTNFHDVQDKLIHNNIKGYFNFPYITLEKPYFWKVIGNRVLLQKRVASTIAEFKQ